MAHSHLSRRCFLSASLASLSATSWLGAEEPPALPTVHDWIKQRASDAPLKMRFAGSTAEQCRRWQGEFEEKLRQLLGPHRPPEKWKTTTRQAIDLEDHRREDLLLEAEGHPPLPIYLLLPRGEKKKRAGIVAIHGHGAHGYHPVAGRDDLVGVDKAIQSANYDYGRQFVRRGYVVAVPCLTPFGPRLGNPNPEGRQDPCATTFVRMQLLGKVLMAENLRDCLWAVELVANHPKVDPTRLGCVGLSYGGRMTMLTSALEPRIKAAVVSGALNVMQERVSVAYSCGAQVIPGLLEYGDVPEIGSLIAPRHCVWEVGSRDGLIKPKWADEAINRMRRAYKALGADGHLVVDQFEGGHRWNGVVGYPLMEKVLG